MTIALVLPVSRWAFLGGMLLALGITAPDVSADEPKLRPTSDPVLLPVPIDQTVDVPTFTLPPSQTTQKLVLVSAEIDARAEQPRVSQLEKGSSSRRLRKEAINDLPQRRLNPQQRKALDDVIDSISVFRRLPAFQCELDPRVHDYFTHHPDVAVSIWRAMGISRLQMRQTGPFQYEIDTQDGTTGVVTVLHQSRESYLVHCEGLFKSPYLSKAIHAKSLMHLRTSFGTDPKGRVYATHQADLFVSFPSQKIGAIAKLISPVSNAIIDRNFQEISLFIHVMWQAMTKQPGWVERIADRIDGVHPARKDELIKLTADVYVTARTNLRRRTGLPVSLDIIRLPEESPARTALTPAVEVVR